MMLVLSLHIGVVWSRNEQREYCVLVLLSCKMEWRLELVRESANFGISSEQPFN